MTKITVPCEYRHPEGEQCKKGIVLVYGELGHRLPERIKCPVCNGSGTIEVEKRQIEEEIADLEEDIVMSKERIAELKSWMNKHRNWDISYNPPPIPIRTMDWTAIPPDYNGEEGTCLRAESLEALKEQIDSFMNKS